MGFKITAPVRVDISGGWPDSDPYRKDFGGAVLNAAIDLRVSAELQAPNLITSLEQVPESSGLGTSGALRVAYIVASNNSLINDKIDLIKRVHKFENEVLKQRAGFQDEAAAVYGGVNYWEFGSNGSIKKIPISEESANHLEERLVLVYTGENHLSSNIHDLVFGPGNYEKNIPKLDRMKELAGEMVRNLTDERVMTDLINETWELQRSLHESIETDTMRSLLKSAKGFYSAARATGAGGGGCMIFYTELKNSLLRYISGLKKSNYVEAIPFKFDYEGIRMEKK